MEQTEINKSNKIKMFILTMLILLVSVAGISYAYFTIQVVGNDTASSMRLRTANMSLVYNDVQIISGEYAEPGWTQTKTLTVTNNGNVTANYTIIWRDLYNEVINGELVISATCSSSSGSCPTISETAVPTRLTESTGAAVKANISIAPGVTHTYTLTALFKETGSNQNYNQNKEFYGTLNLAEATEIRRNGTDATTGLPVVKIGATEEFLDLTNAIGYSSLDSAFLTRINYDSSKSILIAKYNLYVGRICTETAAESCTLVDTSSNDYGLQNEEAKAFATTPHVGVVPFAGSTTETGYWHDETTNMAKSQYGTYVNDENNIYDTKYTMTPNWSSLFKNSVDNVNYSVAYYVEEYVDRLGIEGTGRLLTYPEAAALSQTQRANETYYWLGSANYKYSSNYHVSVVREDGYIGAVSKFNSSTNSGVRPVIVVNTADIQSS